MHGRGMLKIDLLGPSAMTNAGIESGTPTTMVVALGLGLGLGLLLLPPAAASAAASAASGGGGYGVASMIGAANPFSA